MCGVPRGCCTGCEWFATLAVGSHLTRWCKQSDLIRLLTIFFSGLFVNRTELRNMDNETRSAD